MSSNSIQTFFLAEFILQQRILTTLKCIFKPIFSQSSASQLCITKIFFLKKKKYSSLIYYIQTEISPHFSTSYGPKISLQQPNSIKALYQEGGATLAVSHCDKKQDPVKSLTKVKCLQQDLLLVMWSLISQVRRPPIYHNSIGEKLMKEGRSTEKWGSLSWKVTNSSTSTRNICDKNKAEKIYKWRGSILERRLAEVLLF